MCACVCNVLCGVRVRVATASSERVRARVNKESKLRGLVFFRDGLISAARGAGGLSMEYELFMRKENYRSRN